MFKEHKFVVWGTYCKCENECSILQSGYHPWDDSDFTIKLKCSKCGNEVVVDKDIAKVFYNDKIHSYFDDLEGKIVDLGCGGGFLSRYILPNKYVSKVYGVDIDKYCTDELVDIIDKDAKFEFREYDGNSLINLFGDESIDYLVSRDVFMFIEDTDRYFDDVSKLVTKEIRHMGWYIKSNERMRNKLTPQEIATQYLNRGWRVELEYLDWYKSGYFIKAYK